MVMYKSPCYKSKTRLQASFTSTFCLVFRVPYVAHTVIKQSKQVIVYVKPACRGMKRRSGAQVQGSDIKLNALHFRAQSNEPSSTLRGTSSRTQNSTKHRSCTFPVRQDTIIQGHKLRVVQDELPTGAAISYGRWELRNCLAHGVAVITKAMTTAAAHHRDWANPKTYQ